MKNNLHDKMTVPGELGESSILKKFNNLKVFSKQEQPK